jgi:chromosome segregation ATPase
LLSRARARSEKQSKLNEVRAFNMARLTEIKRLEERKNLLEQRLNEADSGTSNLFIKEKELESELNNVQLVSEEELKNVAQSLKQKRDELRNKEAEVRTTRDQIVSAQSSVKAMQDQIISASPLNQLKKTLSADVLTGLNETLSVFVEGLVVPSKYTKAVQSILSERAAFLVAENPESIAKAFLDRISTNQKSSNSGAGIGILLKGDAQFPVANSNVPFSRVLDVIEVKSGFKAAALALLQNVYVADSSQEVFNYFASGNNSDNSVVIVTLDGEIHTPVSFFSLRHDGGLIQVQAKVRELQSQLVELEAVQSSQIEAKEKIQEEVQTLEVKQSELLRESESKQKIFRELTANLASLRGRLQVEVKQTEQLKADIERAINSIKEVEHKIEEGKKEEQILVELSGQTDKEGEAKIEEEIKVYSAQLKEVEEKRKVIREQLSTISNMHRNVQSQIDSSKNGLNSAELALQKIELEKQHIEERVTQEYGSDRLAEVMTIDENYSPIGQETCNEYESEAQKIRSKIIREGEVDSTSIERYKEESTRLTELQQQRNDLSEACLVLKKTIARLEEVSKARFVSMFNSVSQNFSRLIPQLFGGGKGSLQLTDPSRPLETGVDIVMRPPGKKPKSIDLLSGGEKALCATALIFSIFLEKPSPICVLDEVDAPLDEANLIRFLSMVKQMSGRTQFLIVTHNKRSMATADQLIGVTMQQPGTSTVISVSLQEAIDVGAIDKTKAA